MSDLIERLEQASEGSRELDSEIRKHLVADELMKGREGAEVRAEMGHWDEGYDDTNIPDYTTSIDAALTLWPDGYTYTLGAPDWSGMGEDNLPTAPAWANCFKGHNGDWHLASAATPALALCVAALKAHVHQRATHR